MQILVFIVSRFRSAVPNLERKIQIALTGAATTFLAISQINWPGKLAIIGASAGYISATCAGMALVIQFAEDTARKIAEMPAVEKSATTSANPSSISPDPQNLKSINDGQFDSSNSDPASQA